MHTGLLNLPYPFFDWLQGSLVGWADLTGQVLLWGGLAGASSMALYWLVSPQGKLQELGERARQSRHRLLDSNVTSLAESLGIARQLIWLSGHQVLLTFLPVLVAALPFVSLLAWTSDRYGYHLPQGGEIVNVAVEPGGVGVRSVPAAFLPDQCAQLCIFWPPPGGTVLLLDSDGRDLAMLSGNSPVTVMHKYLWWNRLLGNTAGYLPNGTQVESLTFALKPQEFLPFGPSWVRSAEFLFMLAASVVSLAMKCGLHIR